MTSRGSPPSCAPDAGRGDERRPALHPPELRASVATRANVTTTPRDRGTRTYVIPGRWLRGGLAGAGSCVYGFESLHCRTMEACCAALIEFNLMKKEPV